MHLHTYVLDTCLTPSTHILCPVVRIFTTCCTNNKNNNTALREDVLPVPRTRQTELYYNANHLMLPTCWHGARSDHDPAHCSVYEAECTQRSVRTFISHVAWLICQWCKAMIWKFRTETIYRWPHQQYRPSQARYNNLTTFGRLTVDYSNMTHDKYRLHKAHNQLKT